MSGHKFHALYLAPLIVAILGAIISAIGAYYFPQSSPVLTTAPPPNLALPPPSGGFPLANEVEFPNDAPTQNLLQDYIKDAAAATAKYQGKEVQVCSIIALVEPSGIIELYGATTKNQVEGIYFKCSLQKKDDMNGLERNQLVILKGKVKSYFHHRKSPHILIESCCLMRP